MTILAKVSISTDAARHGIFEAAMAVEAAVVLTVLDGTIVSQEWWGALARAKAIANALRVAGK